MKKKKIIALRFEEPILSPCSLKNKKRYVDIIILYCDHEIELSLL